MIGNGGGNIPISIANPLGLAYLNGDSDDIGSRCISIDPDTDEPVIKKLTALDVWSPSSFKFSAETVWADNVGFAGMGHHMATESRDGHFHFMAHSEFDGETSISDGKMLKAPTYTPAVEYQPDFSGEWSGTEFDFT